MLMRRMLTRSAGVAAVSAATLIGATLANLPPASAASTYEVQVCNIGTFVEVQVQGVNQHGTYVFSPVEWIAPNSCYVIPNWWWVAYPELDYSYGGSWYAETCDGILDGYIQCPMG
jgi:hypothetical protein